LIPALVNLLEFESGDDPLANRREPGKIRDLPPAASFKILVVQAVDCGIQDIK
jgi:hypothetical protein